MKVVDFVRKYVPGVDDEEADYIAWNHTGFPGFFQRGLASFANQLKRYQLLRTWKALMCDLCRSAVGKNVGTCEFCMRALKSNESGEPESKPKEYVGGHPG